MMYKLIYEFFTKDPVGILNFLFDLIQRIPVVKSLPRMYEVLDYTAQVHIKDNTGRVVHYSKKQKVRFLQDNVIAFQDKAWGDGDIFADYKCSPGVEVDRYRDGHRYNILISLRETKHRDDVMTFLIERKIKNGFTQPTEEFQTEIEHRTHRLELSVIFPKTRLPTIIKLVEQNTQRSQELDSNHRQILPSGEHKYTWKTTQPSLHEAYIIKWQW